MVRPTIATDLEILRSGLAPFWVSDAAFELRILKTPQRTVSGYFRNLDTATTALDQATHVYNGAAAFYVTLNPVNPQCHARAVDRLKPFAESTTKDADVLRRQYLLIDCDVVRPADISSTDGELAEALAVRNRIVSALTADGWPAPIRAMSGNGGHALYRIDLPNTDAARDLVKACLGTLAARFNTAGVTVDQTVFNAARIIKAYGTWARKGDDTPERPHRQSCIEDAPETLTVVTDAQLAQLAGQTPAPRPPSHRTIDGEPRASTILNMPAEFEARGWYLRDLGGGKHAVVCPWADQHSGQSGLTETVLFDPRDANTPYGFKCQHAHCAGRSIADVWALFRSPADDWVDADDIVLPTAGTTTTTTTPAATLDPALLEDATRVIAEGQRIAATGVPYLVEGLIPAYGMLGMSVAFAKVGKTTFGQQLGAAVATGRLFLDRRTTQTRVLIIAAEDPPEYTAWLARFLEVSKDVLTFYRAPIRLDVNGLTQIVGTVQADGYGLVLIASWQSVVRGLIRDENDNAGAVRIVEDVKAATRTTGVPWLIDAHSGKGEDQTDDADPNRAMRGASGAAGAADYMLSLRYANTPFGSQRRLSGKGRFVSCAPLVLDYDQATGVYSVLGASKDTTRETTWRLLCETGAVTTTFQSIDAIAKQAGLVNGKGAVTGTGRRQVRAALFRREGIRTTSEIHRGQETTLYARVESN